MNSSNLEKEIFLSSQIKMQSWIMIFHRRKGEREGEKGREARMESREGGRKRGRKKVFDLREGTSL